jgi:hypothetical protein
MLAKATAQHSHVSSMAKISINLRMAPLDAKHFLVEDIAGQKKADSDWGAPGQPISLVLEHRERNHHGRQPDVRKGWLVNVHDVPAQSVSTRAFRLAPAHTSLVPQ